MKPARKAAGRKVIGFGFEPARSPYHFVVHLEPGEDGAAYIEERFSLEEVEDARPPVLKVSLDRYRWSRIAEQVRANFNKRLREAGLPTAKWKVPGETVLAAHLGKELTLLAWAVEDADPTVIPNMVANWLGLAPEERWWLYTTVNATAGHPQHGRERGWRKAIKIAFAENPADLAPATLLDSSQEAPRLPLPAEFAELGRPREGTRAGLAPAESQSQAVSAAAGKAKDADRAGTELAEAQRSGPDVPDYLAQTVAAQLRRKPNRPKDRGQIPLLVEDGQ